MDASFADWVAYRLTLTETGGYVALDRKLGPDATAPGDRIRDQPHGLRQPDAVVLPETHCSQ